MIHLAFVQGSSTRTVVFVMGVLSEELSRVLKSASSSSNYWVNCQEYSNNVLSYELFFKRKK